LRLRGRQNPFANFWLILGRPYTRVTEALDLALHDPNSAICLIGTIDGKKRNELRSIHVAPHIRSSLSKLLWKKLFQNCPRRPKNNHNRSCQRPSTFPETAGRSYAPLLRHIGG
jgi:hypothetical protein